jgi:L-threonylcarbamoyladenylate synthase
MRNRYHCAMSAQIEREIDDAARMLEAGQLVAFPTETVYGLGADASNPAALERIFAAKGRPTDHPLIVHLASPMQVVDWARDFPQLAQRLAREFWPGPLTLVLPRAAGVLDLVTGGQDTVALRVPSHPIARALLRRFGRGIAAPSANRYGRISPTCAAHVRDELGNSIGLVLDGGDCEVGLESTIVACSDEQVTLLRPGKITRAQLERIVGRVEVAGASAPRTPGTLRSHYAPSTPVELAEPGSIDQRCTEDPAAGRLAVLSRRPPPVNCRALAWRSLPADPGGFGHGLYAALRALDASGASTILVERVPASADWAAIRDRLERASTRDLRDET